MKKVFVMMSGGVDSSVAAALLKRQGHEIIGVFMKNWSGDDCLWAEDQEMVRLAAEKIGIPFYTMNFEKEYKEKVVEYFFKEYEAGRTPNPDVMCNREIKFGLFFERARALGADYIATGHYARRVTRYALLKAKDKNKNQTYFLWTLTQKQLKHTLFPIGNYTKPEVRALAKKFGLPNAERKDSQGICFIGPVDVQKFLETRIPRSPGKVITTSGEMIGTHKGVQFYTIGQRQGWQQVSGSREQVAVKDRPALYVVAKNLKTNTLVVGKDKETYGRKFTVSDLHFVNPGSREQVAGSKIKAAIRYRQTPEKATLILTHKDKGTVEFAKPVRAITPGQSVVFYTGNEVLGGGVID